MSNLDDLRAQLRKRRAAVTNKIGRIRRKAGAELANTEFDPRRKVGSEKRYNRSQLEAHLRQLNEFMSRGNQFVGGESGAPIRRGTWNTLQRLNAEVRAAQENHAGRMDNLPAPLLGDVNKGERGATIGETRALLHPKADGGVKGPYAPIDFGTSTIPGERAAKAITESLRKQLRSSYLPGKINQGRENLKKALRVMGEETLVQRVDELSDNAFDALWFGSAFAEITFMKYDVEQARAAGTSKERWQDRVVDNAYDDIGRFLEWATELDNDGNGKGSPERPNKRR